ncbi:glycerophosphodiester phosphodiesterase [Actinocorallia sp. API 0066]|uniref:glycerophosphodiester phosphodiesterase n=1 Tax=Actinocorallia sp. API 0066 TaxID=2896846 RepID=UPI001E2EEA55|nr:glycerophosphodiester phosphodiesterase [Actinocorallia sp. API 0066]MCD0453745.1 glycerophosphodiester phosphodiesterase [Actinocorallia sp. API 0066]
MTFDGGPTIIGHRGLGGGAGENTLASLLGAVEAGLSWVEIDVQRTADDRLILAHDPVDEAGAFHVDTAAASGALTLEEVFSALPPHVGVDVDVKTILEDALDPRTAPLLKDVLKAEAQRRPLIVTSFDPSVLLALDGTGIPRGLLTWLWFPIGHAIAAASGLGLEAVALHTASCDPTPKARPFPDCVETAHKSGLQVIVWTPKPESLTPYLAADALVVDDVPGTLKALAR